MSSDGAPPRVVFNAETLKHSGGFALYRDGTIYLKPFFAHAEHEALNIVNWKHPRQAQGLVEAVNWSMAVTLVHETIHFMDHDIDGKEAVDAHTAGYDIGDKWEYFLFGKYGISWGPPHYLNQTTAPHFLKFLDWVEVAQDPELQKLNANALEKRWSRILALLGRQRNGAPPPTPKESPK